MAEEEHEGASVGEILIEACRRNNTDLLQETIAGINNEAEVSRLLNDTVTVMGNHLYHEAAAQGNYEIIDMLLDQPGFECDPISRIERDTPLHTAIRWINSEPPAQREFGNALVDMMLEAGSNPRVRNKGGLTPVQLVDPRNAALRDLIQKHEYAALNAGDFIDADEGKHHKARGAAPAGHVDVVGAAGDDDDADDADFSGSDEEERAEWERRRRAKR